MRKLITTSACITASVFAQTNPAISSWLQNTTVKGRHYVSGNSTAITDASLTANVQSVQYSANFVYATTQGIPSYVVGPYLDGNTNQAGNQNAIFKFPLTPVQNTATAVATSMGNIGVFINGAAMFNCSDGISWKNSTGAFAGGPLGGAGDGVWNRDAIVYEKAGFDCSKGHPAGTNYHHHQNPSAFDLDLNVISTICNLYDADGLYAIDSTVHSPLIGFAYDGFPVYGAYAYKNTNGTGGIVRMKSSFSLRNITVRNTLYTGASVTSGPPVNTTYPLGSFREDYQFNTPTASDYLDIHNGRFCVTPEYPAGTYCYFATVDANWNSAYPYLIGPTYYGTKVAAKVTSISEAVTSYTASSTGVNSNLIDESKVNIFPNPATDLIAIQIKDLVKENYDVVLYDVTGKVVEKKTLYQGSTIVYFDTKTIYSGVYFVKIIVGDNVINKKIIIEK
jgi:hypothetical protein